MNAHLLLQVHDPEVHGTVWSVEHQVAVKTEMVGSLGDFESVGEHGSLFSGPDFAAGLFQLVVELWACFQSVECSVGVHREHVGVLGGLLPLDDSWDSGAVLVERLDLKQIESQAIAALVSDRKVVKHRTSNVWTAPVELGTDGGGSPKHFLLLVIVRQIFLVVEISGLALLLEKRFLARGTNTLDGGTHKKHA